MNDIVLIYSLTTLGFFGGFSHCIGMCGPFVITQSNNRLKNIPISDYNNFQRVKSLALLPYHLGRITTYSILGGLSSFLTINIQNIIGFKIVATVFLTIALAIFINILFEHKIFSKIAKYNKLGLLFKTKKINFFPSFFKIKISSLLKILFKNPLGFIRFYTLRTSLFCFINLWKFSKLCFGNVGNGAFWPFNFSISVFNNFRYGLF